VLGRHHVEFLDAATRARLHALCRALGGMPLVEAERLLSEGRVVDARTGEVVRWQPSVSVYPVSQRMRDRLTEVTEPTDPMQDLALRP